MYAVYLQYGWDSEFVNLDRSTQDRIFRKIERMKEKPARKHLRNGAGYFVEKVGQYRIVFVNDENTKAKYVYFVGCHKSYERWIGMR